MEADSFKCACCSAEFSIDFDEDLREEQEVQYCPFCGSILTEELEF